MAKLKLTAAVLALGLLAASPAAAQQPDPTGLWEGRWRSWAEHEAVEPGSNSGQLQHKGFLEARFEFCVGKDGAITGTGEARVTRNGASRLEKVYPDGDWVKCSYTYSPTQAKVPVQVLGQRRGSGLWLLLNTGPVQFQVSGSCTKCCGVTTGPYEYSGTQPPASIPAAGLLVGSPGNPLFSGFVVSAGGAATPPTEGFDVTASAHEGGLDNLAKYRNHVEVLRPRDAAHELPILLGQVFGSLSHSWDPMELYPSGERKLESILPEIKAALDEQSGRPRCGRPAITIVKGKGPDEDDLFLEALNRARRDQLRNWFAERGIDVSRIDWKTEFGAEDDVRVSFGN